MGDLDNAKVLEKVTKLVDSLISAESIQKVQSAYRADMYT